MLTGYLLTHLGEMVNKLPLQSTRRVVCMNLLCQRKMVSTSGLLSSVMKCLCKVLPISIELELLNCRLGRDGKEMERDGEGVRKARKGGKGQERDGQGGVGKDEMGQEERQQAGKEWKVTETDEKQGKYMRRAKEWFDPKGAKRQDLYCMY